MINNKGVVAGSALKGIGRIVHKNFIYSGGLYTFLGPEGWSFLHAKGINDNGWVVSDGYIDGNRKCFLAIPDKTL